MSRLRTRVAIDGSGMTFVVRLTRDRAGRIAGVVQQVKTGLKARVEGLDALGQVIGEMSGDTSSRIDAPMFQSART